MAKAKKSDFISTGLVAQNRRAHFDYLIEQKYTAGLELTGTEVKSLRLGHANINDAYGIEKDGELFISNMFPDISLHLPLKAHILSEYY